MAERLTASAPGSTPPTAQPTGETSRDRFRTAPTPLTSRELPNWFWGVIGFLTVLGVGFSILFLVVKSPGGASPGSAAAPSAPASGATPPLPTGRPPGIQVEQLGPRPAPVPAPVRKQPRPIKVARLPALGPRPAAKVEGAGDEETAAGSDAETEETPKRKAPAHVRAAAAPESDDSSDEQDER